MVEYLIYDQLNGKFVNSSQTDVNHLKLPERPTLDFEPYQRSNAFGILEHVLINPPMLLHAERGNIEVEDFPFSGHNLIFKDVHTQTENLKLLVKDRIRKGNKVTHRLRKRLGISLFDYFKMRILKK